MFRVKNVKKILSLILILIVPIGFTSCNRLSIKTTYPLDTLKNINDFFS